MNPKSSLGGTVRLRKLLWTTCSVSILTLVPFAATARYALASDPAWADPRDQQAAQNVSSAILDYEAAVKACSEYPEWTISGKIQNRTSGGRMVIRGTAVSSSARPSAAGWLVEEADIVVIHSSRGGITSGQYTGKHYFLGTTHATNVYGVRVLCKLYGDFPASYYRVQRQRAAAADDVKIAARALEASVLQSCDAANRVSGPTETTRLRSAERCVSIARFLAGYGLDAGTLDRRAVLELSEAAISAGDTGSIETSVKIAQQAMRLEKPAGAFGLDSAPPSLFAAQPPSADTASKPISDMSANVYRQHPDIPHRLLAIWSRNLPPYINRSGADSATVPLVQELSDAMPHVSADDVLVSSIHAAIEPKIATADADAAPVKSATAPVAVIFTPKTPEPSALPAPNFYARSLDGRVVDLEALRGKVIVVCFIDPRTDAVDPSVLDQFNDLAPQIDHTQVEILPVTWTDLRSAEGIDVFKHWKIKRPLANLDIFTAYYEGKLTPEASDHVDRFYRDTLVVIGKDGNVAGTVRPAPAGPQATGEQFDGARLLELVREATARGN